MLLRPSAVLFACTHNAIRSPMAEGILKHLAGRRIFVDSAGVRAGETDPFAVQVVDEIGIDIRGQTSKAIDPALLARADWVITLCGDARDRCPTPPPGARHRHWDLEDPARVQGGEAQRLEAFRRVRDELARRLRELARELQDEG